MADIDLHAHEALAAAKQPQSAQQPVLAVQATSHRAHYDNISTPIINDDSTIQVLCIRRMQVLILTLTSTLMQLPTL